MAADYPLIVDSLRVVDATLKIETPHGPSWHRYNHDGYGQQPDGGPFVKWGQGRAWPLLTGERGHYELAAAHDVRPFLSAMERFSNGTGLLPEQIWDQDDLPDAHMRCGGPTGSANPFLWAHSEYLRLLRSAHDRKVFDLIPEVAERYRSKQGQPGSNSGNQIIPSVKREGPSPSHLRARALSACIGPMRAIPIGGTPTHGPPASAVNIWIFQPTNFDPRVEFTFFWKDRGSWEGRNYQVEAY